MSESNENDTGGGDGTPAPIALVDMVTGYQGAALLGTAVETGLTEELAGGAKTLDQLVATLGTDQRGTMALLSGLCSFGVVAREDDPESGPGGTRGSFSLTSLGAPLASSHPDSVTQIILKEWFFYKLWAELPQAVADGHARTGPWRERLENDPDQAHSFLRALDDLCTLFGGQLPELAGLDSGGRLLDVGGGAGSHAANLVKANPGLEATVLDLPGAEPVQKERHPELSFVEGDLDQPRFGRPEGEAWDFVLLANILHDHPEDRNRGYVAQAASLLAPGGSLVVYEWVIDPGRTSPDGVARFTPMMVVENEGGWTWTEAEIAGWMREAGLEPQPMKRGFGPIAVIRADRP
jgi:SAM-dependent methyltransferase